MKQDFIIDFETVGDGTHKSVIIDAAYVVFDWERFTTTPYSFQELIDLVRTSKFDVKDQISHGYFFSKEDLKFWERLPKEAQYNLKPSKNDLTYTEFSVIMLAYIREFGSIKHWWSRGNSFDPLLLERIMRDVDQSLLAQQYLPWWQTRDTRTWIDAKLNFPIKNAFIPVLDDVYWKETFVTHDSRHDVAADILRLQTIHRAENDLEMINR